MKRGRTNRRPEAWIYVSLALATVVVYWPVHSFEFLNFDDLAYVASNPQVFHGLSAKSFLWAFTNIDTNWHPLTWLSHMLDCQLFGHEAGLHHLMNVLFHTANALLLFGLFRRLTGAVYRSALVAALFALHPLHVESVAWIAERKDVLSTFFGLLALNAYGCFAARSKDVKPKIGIWYGLSLAFFAMSLMSKAMLVTMPFLLLVVDFWPLQRLRVSNLRRLLLEKLPFLLLSVADSVVTVIAQKTGEAVVDAVKLPISERVANAIVAYVSYLQKMIWPSDLAAYYPYRHHLPAGEIVFALLFLVLVSVLAFRLVRRAPYLLFGWFWYLGMSVPVIGLVQVGAQSMADRYTYLSLTGVFVMCVWGIADLLSGFKYRKKIEGVSSAVVLVVLAAGTYVQEGYWHDSETLFRRDLVLMPENNVMAHHCLGRALFDRGADTEAQSHFEEVLRLAPDFAPGHLNLANCLSRQGKYDEAMIQCQEARRLKPQDPEVYKCLGATLAANMKLEEARTNFLTAIRYKPDYVEAYTKLATTEMALGKSEEAINHLTTAVAIYPDYHEAQFYLAHALEDQMKFEEAAAHYLAAIKANPDYADAMNDLARMWLTLEKTRRVNLAESIQLAGHACDLTQNKNSACLETLGIAFSEAGEFGKAVETAEKAAAAANAEGNREIMAALQNEIAAYRGGRSYFGITNP